MATYIVHAPNGRQVTVNTGRGDSEFKHGAEIQMDARVGDRYPHILTKLVEMEATAPVVLKEVPPPVKLEEAKVIVEVPKEDLESSVLSEKPKSKRSYSKK